MSDKQYDQEQLDRDTLEAVRRYADAFGVSQEDVTQMLNNGADKADPGTRLGWLEAAIARVEDEHGMNALYIFNEQERELARASGQKADNAGRLARLEEFYKHYGIPGLEDIGIGNMKEHEKFLNERAEVLREQSDDLYDWEDDLERDSRKLEQLADALLKWAENPDRDSNGFKAWSNDLMLLSEHLKCQRRVY